jgi:hypothetical protein
MIIHTTGLSCSKNRRLLNITPHNDCLLLLNDMMTVSLLNLCFSTLRSTYLYHLNINGRIRFSTYLLNPLNKQLKDYGPISQC